MGINYGQLMAMILGTGGIAALGGHMRAKKLNEYDDALNANLQAQGAQPLALPHKNFAFGDTADTMTAHKSLYEQALKAHQDKQSLDDYNQQGQQYGMPRFNSPTAAKDIIGPYTTQDATHKLAGAYGQKELPGAMALQNLFSSAPPQGQQQQLPPMFAPGSTSDNPTLQTGTSKTQLPPELDGMYITHEMIKDAQARQTSMRGQDLTAQTASEGHKLTDARERLKMIEQHRHNTATEQVQARNAASAEKRAQVYARTAGLHGMTQADQVLATYKAGRMSEAEYKSWLLYHGGGDTDTTSVTTNANGEVTSQTHTHRGKSGTPGTAAPGHSVDVGGGVQIKGF